MSTQDDYRLHSYGGPEYIRLDDVPVPAPGRSQVVASTEVVGSARAPARPCEEHLAYQWLCGGVGMNHKTLADFRVACGAVLEQSLIDSFAALLKGGIASLAREARRAARPGRAAEASPSRTPGPAAAEVAPGDEAPPRREARVSTTDVDAELMKMAAGGFRPAYDVQLAADTRSGAVAQACGTRPGEPLVDGGFAKFADIARMAKAGVAVYAPVPASRDPERDRHTPCPDDPAAAARTHDHRRRQGDLQGVGRDHRTHRCAGARLRADAIRGSRRREGQGRGALVRPRPRHGLRMAPHPGVSRQGARLRAFTRLHSVSDPAAKPDADPTTAVS